MSGLRRIISHPDAARSDHLRARLIAASLLDGPATAEDEAWLTAHLGSCAACSEAATAFSADRAALHALPGIDPPRDLWARTAAGLDQEDARRGYPVPRGPVTAPAGRRPRRSAPRRSGLVLPLLALVLVIGLVGGTTLSGLLAGPGTPTVALGSARPGPAATPIAVAAGAAAWVTRDRSGSYVLNAASVSEVCPVGSAECARLGSTSRTVFNSSKRPASVVVSRGGEQAILFDEPDGANGGSVSVLFLPAPFPTPDPTRRPTPTPGATARPSVTAPPTNVPDASGQPNVSPSASPVTTPAPTANPSASAQPIASPSVEPPASPVATDSAASPSPSNEPGATEPVASPSGSNEPTASEPVATEPVPSEQVASTPIVSAHPAASPSESPSETQDPNPSEAASPDTSSAVPSQSPVATDTPPPATARSLAILDRVVVVGNSAAFSPDNRWFAFSARPADGSRGPDVYLWRVGDSTGAEPITKDHRSVFASWAGHDILVSGPDLEAAGADATKAPPISRLIDPSTGQSRELETAAMWSPVVDPAGHLVAYWSGTLVLDRATRTWRPDHGRLYLADWRAAAGTLEAGTKARPERPARLLATDDPIDAWEARWDTDGVRLAVWIGSGGNPDVGRLSLLEVDSDHGTIDRGSALLTDAVARAGFSMGEDRLVWAAPEGGRDASRILVLAWSGANAGQIRADPSAGDALVTVAR